MTKITRKAPAKINLLLDVKSKRPDGYHDIESVMQTVTLFDELTFVRGERAGKHIALTCSTPELPCGESNLCYRAARLFFDAAGIDDYDASIHIDKHIPISAGLGGGSSDAAATLLGLNELYSAGLTRQKLCDIGGRLGADVPFCIMQGILITRGIGDEFSHCGRLPDCHIAVACHGEGVSTVWAYGRLDELHASRAAGADADSLAELIDGGDIRKIADGMANIFESVVLPEREAPRKVRDIFNECGALRAMMSGSGPSVIGLFDDEACAKKAQRRLSEHGIAAHICKPYYPDEA